MSDDEAAREVEEADRAEDGRRRLFDALEGGAPLEDIRSIVEAFPKSVECDPEAKDRGGNKWCSALHMATRGDELDVVQYLATQNPEALKTRDHNGRLPLHLAVFHRAELPVVRTLVEMYPDALHEPIDDKSGHLPLHCALLKGYSRPDVTVFLIRQYPAAVRVRTANGNLPLHLAFSNDRDDDVPVVGDDDEGDEYMGNEIDYDYYLNDMVTPVEVISALLEAWPDSVMKTDPHGCVALHLACMNPMTSVDVIRRLHEAWPTSLNRRDIEKGHLPIHYAIMTGMPIGVVSFLATELPRSVNEPTDAGNLPLHLHLMSLWRRHGNQEDSFDLVRLLVSHCPLSVRHKCGREDSSLAVHLAVRYRASLDVVKFLVQKWRKSLRVKNDYGLLALHLAVQHSESLDIVRFLVEQCPMSVQMRTASGSTALHVAAEDSPNVAAKLRIVRFVHQSWPDALREKTKDGSTPLHEAAKGSFRGSRAIVRLEVIRYFLNQIPGLVGETDRRGCLPLHIAASLRPTLGAIRLLVDRGPKSLLLARRGDNGKVALHEAVTRIDRQPPWAFTRNRHLASSQDVVQILVEQCPEALQVADFRGFLPLHAALFASRCEFGRFWDLRMPVVRYVVKAWPQALEVRDVTGRIPLLVAAESYAPLDVLFHLLTSGPQSIGGLRRGWSRAQQPRLA